MPLVMMICAEIVAEIDQRVRHIAAQVKLGANKEVVVSEQYQALLATFATLRGVQLETISRVSDHLATREVFDRQQLLACSASLRVAAATRLDQPIGERPLQSNASLEYSLSQSVWDRLEHLPQQSKKNTEVMQQVVGGRMHRLGVVCPDADTLNRASAIVQAASGNAATATDKRELLLGIRNVIKTLDRHVKWPFEYIRNSPRSPFDLPGEVLHHAYGQARPVNPPPYIDTDGFQLMVAAPPYKKNKSDRLDQTRHRVETPIRGCGPCNGCNHAWDEC